MTAALYRVTFHEVRSDLGTKPVKHLEPAKMPPGWRIVVRDDVVLVITPPNPPAIGAAGENASGIERDANGIAPSECVLVTEIPRNLCALHYVVGSGFDQLDLDAVPGAPSQAFIEARKAKEAGPPVVAPVAPVEGAPVVVVEAVPPVRLPTPRRVPPGGKMPVQPPPSEIVMDAPEGAS